MSGGASSLGAPSAAPRSGAALQVELRRLFQVAPPNIALRQSLARIGHHFSGAYLALHGFLAGEPLSEEWQAESLEVGMALREKVNEAMLGTLAEGVSRCLRLNLQLGESEEGAAIVVAPMFDEELLTAGAAAMIVSGSDRAESIAILSAFESIIGFLALLTSNESELKQRMESAAQDMLRPADAAAASAAQVSAEREEDPWRLGWELVSDLQMRHGVDQVALGIIARDAPKVRVQVVSGMDQVRAGNPGVARIRAAMEECLDRGHPTLWPGRDLPKLDDSSESPDDPRLHRQWSESTGGDPVATVMLRAKGRAVGVVALRHHSVERLRLARLTAIEGELKTWGSLLPLVDRASRGVTRHALETVQRRTNKVVGDGWRRPAAIVAFVFALLLTMALLPVADVVDAPASLVAADARVISTPRAAPLARVLVEVGDHVEKGQILARLDLRSDRLAAEEAEARRDVLEVDIDVARAAGELGDLAALQARLRATEAELAILEDRLRFAEVRAPVAGMIMEDHLQQREGDQLAIGERMFLIASGERLEVQIRVPDRKLPEADRLAKATANFSPYSSPGTEVAMGSCLVPPAATVVEGESVYLVHAPAFPGDELALRPGMEGTARLDLGDVSLWTAWTRPVVLWLRRNLL